MERVELDGVQVEYELLGDREPVVLPHSRPFVSWYIRDAGCPRPLTALVTLRHQVRRHHSFGR
jgi:hypothetical protein